MYTSNEYAINKRANYGDTAMCHKRLTQLVVFGHYLVAAGYKRVVLAGA